MLITLLFTCSLLKTDSTVDPIDKAYTQCHKVAHTTKQLTDCEQNAYTAWEKAIVVTERKLEQHADAEKKRQLENDQLTWEKQRDAAFNDIANRYNKMRGTGYIPVRINLRMKVLRSRALELKAMLHK